MENNGKGIFYGVIGVATLIVAIIGATFAFFTATNTNEGTVAGTAAAAGLKLTVTEATTDTGVMVPQKAEAINTATAGTGGTRSCVDSNNNTACKVYKITIENEGDSAVTLTGRITFAATGSAKFTNLKWTKSDTSATAGFGATQVAIGGTASEDLYFDVDAKTVYLGAKDDAENAGADYDEFWIVVWIDETGAAQETDDTGSFTGTITFNSAAGGGVTSTFTTTA